MDSRTIGTFVSLCLGLTAIQAEAASLQVTPVRIQVDTPAAASKVTVSNPGDVPITAQLRVFKWTRVNGQDQLTPTRDVVASPPLVKLAPGQPYVVRIVRLKKSGVAGEESYRLLVDEIPSPEAQTPVIGPRFAIRQSLPVFFTGAGANAQIEWEASLKKGRLYVSARNQGQKRIRLSELSISAGAGKPLKVTTGLGYVLGRSSEQWAAKIPVKGFAPGTTITIQAQSDNGPIRKVAKIRATD